MRGQLAKGSSVSAKSMIGLQHTRAARAARAPMMEELEGRQLLATYYVSPYGSDSRSGTSSGTAWKSINRVNQQTLKPGDKVLFAGGKSFSGSLLVNSNEGGNSSTQVYFGT